MTSFKGLCDLIVLEQFKSSIPGHIATYLNEHNAMDVLEAAALPDDYVLIHKLGKRALRVILRKGMKTGVTPVVVQSFCLVTHVSLHRRGNLKVPKGVITAMGRDIGRVKALSSGLNLVSRALSYRGLRVDSRQRCSALVLRNARILVVMC